MALASLIAKWVWQNWLAFSDSSVFLALAFWSLFAPCTIKKVHEETHISMLLGNIMGTSITHVALHALKRNELPAHKAALARSLRGSNEHSRTQTGTALVAVEYQPRKTRRSGQPRLGLSAGCFDRAEPFGVINLPIFSATPFGF